MHAHHHTQAPNMNPWPQTYTYTKDNLIYWQQVFCKLHFRALRGHPSCNLYDHIRYNAFMMLLLYLKSQDRSCNQGWQAIFAKLWFIPLSDGFFNWSILSPEVLNPFVRHLTQDSSSSPLNLFTNSTFHSFLRCQKTQGIIWHAAHWDTNFVLQCSKKFSELQTRGWVSWGGRDCEVASLTSRENPDQHISIKQTVLFPL